MEIDLDKESIFTLEMKIDGEVNSSEPPRMRFSIVNENMTISLVAKRVDNGIYQISVPKMVGILEAGEYEANVEVFIDGKHFIPLKETVHFKQEVKPTVKISESSRSTPTSGQITLENIQIKKPLIKKTNQIINS